MREIYIFNIRFIDANFSDIYRELNKGGIMVAPAAPALASIINDNIYHQSLIVSRFAIFDSGFLCMALFLLKKIKVKKFSGLAFMREFMQEIQSFPKDSIFMVDPSVIDSGVNKNLLQKFGYSIANSHQYVAPFYNSENIVDYKLLQLLSTLKPKYIIINLGGGVQEKLAAFLQKEITGFTPSIICTGAAIAFLSGQQASIPIIIDKLHLGWLIRCISDYKRFVPRYFQGLRILPMIFREKIKIRKLSI